MDAYRRRVEGTYTRQREVTDGSVFDSNPKSQTNLRSFLRKAARIPGLLSSW